MPLGALCLSAPKLDVNVVALLPPLALDQPPRRKGNAQSDDSLAARRLPKLGVSG
jgi:hypothetical protein